MPWPPYDPRLDAALGRFGQGLRRAREQRGISQRTAAARCGVRQATISRLENGMTAARSIRWLARLFDAIDAAPAYRPGAGSPDEGWWRW